MLHVSSRVTFNEQFCRWPCLLFYWFGKQKFGKFTNGTNEVPVIGGLEASPSLVGGIQTIQADADSANDDVSEKEQSSKNVNTDENEKDADTDEKEKKILVC